MKVKVLITVILGLLVSDVNAYSDRECLASTLYHEARGEDLLGQQLVAQVVLNRAKYSSICSEVLAPGQFPWASKSSIRVYGSRELMLADYFIKFPIASKVKYFHRADTKHRTWTRNLAYVTQVGKHKFYKDKYE